MQCQPTSIDMPERIVVIGDIHGDIKRLCEILYHAKIITRDLSWISPNTVVVQLGDQVDSAIRSPLAEDWEEIPDVEVLKFTDYLDTIAQQNGGRFLSCIGNHECMNLMGDFSYVSAKSLMLYNADMRKAGFRVKDGQFTKIIAKRNLVLRVGGYIFCHGGLLPQHLDITDNNLETINNTFRKFLLNGSVDAYREMKILDTLLGENGIVWTRFYASETPDTSAVINDVLARTNSIGMIIGHCTVPIVTVLQGRVLLADTGISRSFGKSSYQYIQIRGTNIEVVTI